MDLADPVTVLSAHSVRINVTAPSPFLLSVLASADATIYDRKAYLAHASPSDPWAQAWGADNSASYCAYYVASFIPGSELVLAANPGFWGHPYYTSVIIRQVPDPGDRVHDVLTGEATHTTDLDWSDFAVASNQGPATGVTATILQNGPGVLAWHLNVTRGPLANPLVRQAINIGIDRSELFNENLDDGYAAPAVLTIPAAFGATQPNISDPVQARSLMRAAGYPHAITIDVATNDSVAGNQIFDLLAHAPRPAGADRHPAAHRRRRQHRPAARARGPPPGRVLDRDDLAAARRSGVPRRAGRQQHRGPGEHRGAGGLPQPGAADRARPARHDAGRTRPPRRSRSRPRRSSTPRCRRSTSPTCPCRT